MIDFKTFSEIIHAIKRHDILVRDFSKFLEQKICTSSFCYVTFGDEIITCLINVLCREFNVQNDDDTNDNIFTWWLYENVDKKLFYRNGTILDINKIEDFYKYLDGIRAKKEKVSCSSSCHSS